jgi:hypothetical protein
MNDESKELRKRMKIFVIQDIRMYSGKMRRTILFRSCLQEVDQ